MIGILLPNNQHHHIQKDVLPYALCQLLCPVSAALASIFRMDSIPTSYIKTLLSFATSFYEQWYLTYKKTHPPRTLP